MLPVNPVTPAQTTTDEEWAEKQRQLFLAFAKGGPMAQAIGNLLDVKPPKPYAEVLLEQARKAQQQRARETKAEAATPIAPKPTGVDEYGRTAQEQQRARGMVPTSTPQLSSKEEFERLAPSRQVSLDATFSTGAFLEKVGGLMPPRLPVQQPGETEEEFGLRAGPQRKAAIQNIILMAGLGGGGVGAGKAPKGKVPKVGAAAGEEAAQAPITRVAEEAIPEPPLTPSATGEGAAEPPGARPPSAGGEVPEDPVAKLTWLLKGAKKTQPQIEAMAHEERVGRAAGLYRVLEGEGGEVAGKQAQASLRGELPRPSFQPVAEQFTQADRDALFNSIAEHYVAKGKPYNAVSAQNALWKALDQGRVPTMGEIARLQEVFGSELGAALRSKRTLGQKAWSEFLELINVPRGIQAAFDLSYPLRQGIMAAPSHPIEWVRANKEMVRAAINEADATANLAKWEVKQAQGLIPQNLALRKWEASAEAWERSDVMASRFLNSIPGVNRSARAFAVAGNELRGGIAETVINGWKRNGTTITTKEMEDLGAALNYLTGIGPVPKNLSQLASAILYAPAYVTSKPAFLIKMLNPSTSPAVRKLMIREFVSFIGTGIAILSAAKMSGVADVELSPLSSDFGKLRIANTRIDFWGGQQQLARFTAQLIMGQRKTIGTGEFVDASRQAVAARFLLSKLQPVAGVGASIMSGETYMGEPMEFTWDAVKREAWNRIAPMAIQDMVDAVKLEHARGAMVAPLAFFGLGVQTYYTPGEKVQELTQKYDPQGRTPQEMISGEFDQLMNQHPDLAAARQDQLKAAASWGSEWAETQQTKTQEREDFQAATLASLDRRETTYSDVNNAIGDFLNEQRIKGEVRYAGIDFKADTEDKKLLDTWYATYDLLPVGPKTGADYDAMYAAQDKLMAENPRIRDLIKLNHQAIFTDPRMDALMAKRDAAQDVRSELYAIPAFRGLTADEGNEVSRIVARADAMVQAGQAPTRSRALRLLRGQYPRRLLAYARRAERLRSRARATFKAQHQEELSWFSDLPVEGVDTLALAGVP